MKWLEMLYTFNKVKKLVKKYDALLNRMELKKFLTLTELKNFKKENYQFIKTYKHAVAISQQSSLVYNIYFKTSKKQDGNVQNIKVDESNKIYIYYKGEKLHFQNEEEFNTYFEILEKSDLKMQKKLFSEDYLQQLFLEKVKEKADVIPLINGIDQFYFENKLVKKFCLENINKVDYFKRLNELEEVIQQFNKEYEMENDENNELEAEEIKKNPLTFLDE